jgi:enterochelin esterase-like enzyme
MRMAVREVRGRCTHAPVVTAAAVGAVLSTAVRLRVFDHELPLLTSLRYGFSGRSLTMGHWETLATSQFLSRDPFMAISIVCSLIFMLGMFEAVAGSVRTLVVAAVTAVAGPLTVAGGLALGQALGSGWAARTLSTIDYGASSVTAGAGGALVAVLGRRGVRVFAVLWVLGGLVAHHQLADWEHLSSFVVGYGLGRRLGVASPVRWPLVRAYVARATAAVAVGVGFWAGSIGAVQALPVETTHARAAGPGAAAASASPARVEEASYPTPSLGGTRKVLVILPAGYDESRGRYPVVEFLHGSPGAPTDIVTGLDPLGAAAAVMAPAFIGLAPDGRGPVVSEGDFADTSRQRLGAAMSDDLRRWADTTFRTDGHWSVTGLSAGAYGAAYLASRTEGAYDAVCSLSGYFTARAPAFAGESRAVADAASPIRHVSARGPRTLVVTGIDDADGMGEAQNYLAALDRVGQPNERMFVPGAHQWDVWKGALPACMRFMLTSPQGRPAPVGTAP